MRVKITLACTECKQRNYDMMKEKKNHPERMETKKYCKFCKTHTTVSYTHLLHIWYAVGKEGQEGKGWRKAADNKKIRGQTKGKF